MHITQYPVTFLAKNQSTYPAKGINSVSIWFPGDIEGIPPLVSSLDITQKEQLIKRLSASSDDLVLFALGDHASVNKTLDRLRIHIAHELGLVDEVSF